MSAQEQHNRIKNDKRDDPNYIILNNIYINNNRMLSRVPIYNTYNSKNNKYKNSLIQSHDKKYNNNINNIYYNNFLSPKKSKNTNNPQKFKLFLSPSPFRINKISNERYFSNNKNTSPNNSLNKTKIIKNEISFNNKKNINIIDYRPKDNIVSNQSIENKKRSLDDNKQNLINNIRIQNNDFTLNAKELKYRLNDIKTDLKINKNLNEKIYHHKTYIKNPQNNLRKISKNNDNNSKKEINKYRTNTEITNLNKLNLNNNKYENKTQKNTTNFKFKIEDNKKYGKTIEIDENHRLYRIYEYKENKKNNIREKIILKDDSNKKNIHNISEGQKPILDENKIQNDNIYNNNNYINKNDNINKNNIDNNNVNKPNNINKNEISSESNNLAKVHKDNINEKKFQVNKLIDNKFQDLNNIYNNIQKNKTNENNSINFINKKIKNDEINDNKIQNKKLNGKERENQKDDENKFQNNNRNEIMNQKDNKELKMNNIINNINKNSENKNSKNILENNELEVIFNNKYIHIRNLTPVSNKRSNKSHSYDKKEEENGKESFIKSIGKLFNNSDISISENNIVKINEIKENKIEPKENNVIMETFNKQNIKNLRYSLNLGEKKGNYFNPEEFKYIGVIGEGEYGKTYLVQWVKKDNQYYAMKIEIFQTREELNKSQMKSKAVIDFLKKTNSEGIIKIYGDISLKKDNLFYYYVLMEKGEKDMEQELIIRGNYSFFYSERDLTNVLCQLILTCAQLQKNNIAHRDIKPQNILIKSGRYKICDFGESIVLNGSGILIQNIKGTELYMSPLLFFALKKNFEQVKHNVYKSDVFSLGLCILLAATLNYDSICQIREETNMENIKNVILYYLSGRYSNVLISFLLRMLEVEENKRPDFIQLENMLVKK